MFIEKIVDKSKNNYIISSLCLGYVFLCSYMVVNNYRQYYTIKMLKKRIKHLEEKTKKL
jgi:hypothetical protein